MTGPIAPDALRDEVRQVVINWTGTRSPEVQDAIIDDFLAVVAKHQGAETERVATEWGVDFTGYSIAVGNETTAREMVARSEDPRATVMRREVTEWTAATDA